jgi:hypothetical protein
MTYIKQINNLKIKYSKFYEKYQVVTKNKKILEEFEELPKAVKFCEETEDFIK